MRIAIVGSRGYPYVYSGYETFVSELSIRLVGKGHQVVVYCHRGLFDQKPRMVDGVELIYVPAIESKILSQLSQSLLATLHAIFRRYDVVLYVNSANGPLGLLTKLAGIPTAINVDGLEWLRPKWRGLGSRYFRMASFLATRLFDSVIADSAEMAKIYQEEFGVVSNTIAYGADLAHSTHPQLIRQFGVHPDEYYLIVGRLIPDNNGDLLVRAFLASGIKRKLVVVGDVPYRDAYADRLRGLTDERLVFPGYIRDWPTLRELYCNAYVYLHGHEFGGTNPSLLKALACGCCVASLDTPFSREVMADDTHGVYFEKTAQCVTRTLCDLESDRNKVLEFRRIARNRISSNYTWEKITDQYELLFSALRKFA